MCSSMSGIGGKEGWSRLSGEEFILRFTAHRFGSPGLDPFLKDFSPGSLS